MRITPPRVEASTGKLSIADNCALSASDRELQHELPLLLRWVCKADDNHGKKAIDLGLCVSLQ
jgi:hypothetical protein